MKPLLFFLLFVLCFQAEAQKKNANKTKATTNSKGLPSIVESTFKKEYPTVEKVKWVKKGNDFEAQYNEKSIQRRVLYSTKGKAIHTAVLVSVGGLPQPISSYAAIHYPEYQIIEALKIKSLSGIITYEVAVDDTILLFDAQGKIISDKKRIDIPIQ
ncbi:MAG: hypothetical protein ACKOXB_15040 [Flavobacteriales bacterium]